MIKPPDGARPRFGHSFALGLRHAFLLNERSGRQVRDCVTGMHGYFHTGQEPLWGGGAGPDGYFPTMHGSSLLFSGTQYVDGFDGAVFSRGAGEGPFSIIVGFSVAAGSAGTAQTLW